MHHLLAQGFVQISCCNLSVHKSMRKLFN